MSPDPSAPSPQLQPPSLAAPRWIAIAQLLRAQGRVGELLADPLSDLAGLFDPGREVWLGKSDSAPDGDTPTRLKASWQPTGRNAGRIVLHLEGCDSISAAEVLRGRFLLIPADTLPQLAPGTFYVRDLIGCALFDGDAHAGTIVGVEFPVAADGRTRLEAAPDLLAIERPDAADAGEPTLIPFVEAWLVAADLPNRRVTMRLPPGLLAGAEDIGSPDDETGPGVHSGEDS